MPTHADYLKAHGLAIALQAKIEGGLNDPNALQALDLLASAIGANPNEAWAQAALRDGIAQAEALLRPRSRPPTPPSTPPKVNVTIHYDP